MWYWLNVLPNVLENDSTVYKTCSYIVQYVKTERCREDLITQATDPLTWAGLFELFNFVVNFIIFLAANDVIFFQI